MSGDLENKERLSKPVLLSLEVRRIRGRMAPTEYVAGLLKVALRMMLPWLGNIQPGFSLH